MWPIGVVGTDGKKRKFKIIDKHNKIIKGQKYNHGWGELTQTSFVRHPRSKLNAFISGTKQGQLQIMTHPYEDGAFTQQISHRGAITKLQATADFNYFFSAGKDGVLYIYKVDLEKIPTPDDCPTSVVKFVPCKDEEEPRPLVRPSLANVILVSQF